MNKGVFLKLSHRYHHRKVRPLWSSLLYRKTVCKKYSVPYTFCMWWCTSTGLLSFAVKNLHGYTFTTFRLIYDWNSSQQQCFHRPHTQQGILTILPTHISFGFSTQCFEVILHSRRPSYFGDLNVNTFNYLIYLYFKFQINGIYGT